MKHLDPAMLALAALGEELDDEGRRHLRGCAACTAEVDGLSRVTRTARNDNAITLENPEPDVWANVHRELDLSSDFTADPLGDDDGDSTAAVGGTKLGRTGRARPRTAGPTPLWLAAAAAAGIVVGGGAVWALSQSSQSDDRDLLAATQLKPLPGYQTSGEVKVVESGQGARMLAVTARATQTEGYREVWLISQDLEQMYSLGVLAGNQGSFVIPEGVELSQFPIVDISNEPTDGNPAHSGDSVLRGTLPAGNGG